jgi:hypothetical protein
MASSIGRLRDGPTVALPLDDAEREAGRIEPRDRKTEPGCPD